MTPTSPEDDNELPPDEVVTPDDIGPDPDDDDDARGGTDFAGEHPDEPDVAEQPHPDEPA